MENFEKVMEFAIHQEMAEADFYTSLAQQAESADLRKKMLEHAQQELEHKAKLEAILASHRMPGSKRGVPTLDLRIADYTVADNISTGELGYQDSLILAAKRELAAERMYRDLAAQAVDSETAAIFVFLADQEAKHRHQIETDYDENILKEG